MTDPAPSRARLIGLNHVAMVVGDIEEALDFYGAIFDIEIRGRTDSAVFLDMGDQFLALSEVNAASGETDGNRHIGLVVEDLSVVERRLDDLDVDPLPTAGLEFHDPWGNRIQLVAYRDVQFTKADHVLEGMGLADLEKTEAALSELAEKDMAPK